MSARKTPTSHEAPDTALVRACLQGHEAAWAALLDKYKNLIYSIPIRYGFSRDDATDMFQEVCLEMFSELPRLREPKALPKWIIQVTSRKCGRRRQQQQGLPTEVGEGALLDAIDPVPLTEEMLRHFERAESVKTSIAHLPPRCRQLVRALFFASPPRPYEEIAKQLGIATGSIGFIRGRCLKRLRQELLKRGFR